VVTLKPPALVSKETQPAFSGTASEETQTKMPVTVYLYSGKTAAGEAIDTLKATVSAGKWTSAHVSPPLGNGEYTAIAKQESSIGNGIGESESRTFIVNTKAPLVFLEQVPSPSKQTKPAFTGTASNSAEGEQEVTVDVYAEKAREGAIIATAHAKVSGGKWTSEGLSEELKPKEGVGFYTAVATQKSALGNATGESNPVTFEIDTNSPVVTLNQPPSLSKEAPSFSGTASDTKPVVVHVYEGSKPKEGPEVGEITAQPSNGVWESSKVALALKSGKGTFTAVATQESSLGNKPGESSSVTFTVDTLSPKVTLNQPSSPSGNTTPTFTGTASELTEISIEIHAGPSAAGPVVASATAEGDGAEWSSHAATPSLANGEYTAVAIQASSLGNAPGESNPVTFIVEARPPSVATEGTTVADDSALVNGSVNPNGGTVNACSVEYGTTTSYGESIGCGFVNAAGIGCAFAEASGECGFPSGGSAVKVYVAMFGLSPNTTYFFRITASDGSLTGSATGTLTTAPRKSSGFAQVLPRGPASGVSASAQASATTTLAALIVKQLVPSGRAARIAALLKSGGFKELFKAPAAGTAVIDWYYLPRGARIAKKAAPVLVASGRLGFASAKTATIKIRLTATGRRLLSHSKRIRLTAKCIFTPVGEKAITVYKAFQLH
jgi:hypothetical protein